MQLTDVFQVEVDGSKYIVGFPHSEPAVYWPVLRSFIMQCVEGELNFMHDGPWEFPIKVTRVQE